MDPPGLGACTPRVACAIAPTSIDGDVLHVNMAKLMVYGQAELVKDPNETATACGLRVIYEGDEAALHDAGGDAPPCGANRSEAPSRPS